MTPEEALAPFRAAENPVAVLAMRSSALASVLLAWRYVRVEFRPPRRPSPVPPSWDDIWRWCTWSRLELAAATGMDHEELERTIAIARAHRLIYPDGTISRTAQDELDRAAGVTQKKQRSVTRTGPRSAVAPRAADTGSANTS